MTPEERVRSLDANVRRMARHATRSRPWLADDARQEGMLALWIALGRNPDAEERYLTGAAWNGIQGFLRKAGRISEVPLDDRPDVVAPERDLPLAVSVRATVSAVEDDLDRRYLFLRFWEDLTDAEISEALGETRGGSCEECGEPVTSSGRRPRRVCDALECRRARRARQRRASRNGSHEARSLSASALEKRWQTVLRPRLREALGDLAA